MIRESNNKVFNFVFRQYIVRLLKKHFAHFHIVNEVPEITNNGALLVLPNHFSWWDGFFIYLINEYYYKKEFKILMLEEQLNKFKLFRYLGAYSINRTENRAVIESLRYSLELLKCSKNMVVYYPQGEIKLYDDLPIGVGKGAEFLISRLDSSGEILFPTFKIYYTNEKLPSIAVTFRKSTKEEIKKNGESVRDQMNLNIKELNEAVRMKRFVKDILHD